MLQRRAGGTIVELNNVLVVESGHTNGAPLGMLLGDAHPGDGLELELLRRQLEAVVERLDVGLDLLHGEAIDESVILLRFGTGVLRHDHLTIGVGDARRGTDTMGQAAAVLVPGRLTRGSRRPRQRLMVLRTVPLL